MTEDDENKNSILSCIVMLALLILIAAIILALFNYYMAGSSITFYDAQGRRLIAKTTVEAAHAKEKKKQTEILIHNHQFYSNDYQVLGSLTLMSRSIPMQYDSFTGGCREIAADFDATPIYLYVSKNSLPITIDFDGVFFYNESLSVNLKDYIINTHNLNVKYPESIVIMLVVSKKTCSIMKVRYADNEAEHQLCQKTIVDKRPFYKRLF